MDIALSDVGVHVAGSLAAFMAIELCKSLFFRSPSRQGLSDDKASLRSVSNDRGSGRGGKHADDEQARPGFLSRCISWIFLFFLKLTAKAFIAVMAAGFTVSWLQESVDLAATYRLSASTAETLLMVAFFLVLLVVWWILPIRLFSR